MMENSPSTISSDENDMDTMLGVLEAAELEIIRIIETTATLFEKLAQPTEASEIGILLESYKEIRESLHANVTKEISQFIQHVPSGNNNTKNKLEFHIAEATAKHVHQQIRDMLALINKSKSVIED